MRRNKNFILFRFVKINNKIIFIDIIEFKNIVFKKRIIGMFPKRPITNHAQCSH